jgi:hypothetical protein
MDETVHGAVGGNILQAFRMTIDYRHQGALLLRRRLHSHEITLSVIY